LSIQLEGKDLINAQQMEVAINGPDGATHLILCTGVADLGLVNHETYTFLVGPQISRRELVGAMLQVHCQRFKVMTETVPRIRLL
jgi:hypothetical protein